MSLLQKIRCSIPFSFSYFGHKNLKILKVLSDYSKLIQCRDCGKKFAINDSVQIVLPWDDIRGHYE